MRVESKLPRKEALHEQISASLHYYVNFYDFYMIFLYSVSIKESSVAKLGSVCRRIYRIFSHAYFHHRQIFDKYEVSKIIFYYS